MRKLQERMGRSLWLLAVMATTLGLGWSAAQYDGQDNGQNNGQYNDQNNNNNEDPPMEAARLSFAVGAVSVQQAGSEDWAQAGVNFPMAPGDRLFVDQNSSAELEIGRTYVRIDSGTDLSVVEISERGITLGVAQGSIHVQTLGLWPDQELVVSTSNGGINMTRPAEFRVDVYPDQQSTVFTNFSGATHVFAAGGFSDYVYPGNSLQLSGVDPVYPQWLESNPPDQLDEWSMKRDESLRQSISAQYVSPEMPGYNDLDANGNWMPNTPYGPAWFPTNVPYGWAPYHYGHWMNRPFWGWVWVEDEPWGYAPFHYGRWVALDGRWGWLPGPPAMRPIWSPALVAFGGGIQIGGFGISVWFPLGPGEAYRPWYHCSDNYINQVNITNIRETNIVHVQKTYVNVVNVTNITYVNQTVGASAMRHTDFAAGRPMTQVAVRVDPRQMQHIQILARPVPLPVARPLILNKPVHAVPVATMRPMLINQQGKQIQAIPHAQPIEPQVQRTPPEVLNRPLPNRTPVAAPQNHAQPFNQQQPNNEKVFTPGHSTVSSPPNNERQFNEPNGGTQIRENVQPKVVTPEPTPQRPMGNEYGQPERNPAPQEPQRPEMQYQAPHPQPQPQEVRPQPEEVRPQPEIRTPPPQPMLRTPPPQPMLRTPPPQPMLRTPPPQPMLRTPPPQPKPKPKPQSKPAPKPNNESEPKK